MTARMIQRQRMIFKIAEYFYYASRGSHAASANKSLSAVVVGFEESFKGKHNSYVKGFMNLYKGLRPAQKADPIQFTEKPFWS